MTEPNAATLTECGLAWSCPGTVLNMDEVRAARIVPRSFLYDAERDRRGPGHGREDFWTVQGNNLAMWTVERADGAGEFPPGTRLPGERDLSEQYEVGLGTLRKAVGVLRDSGKLVTLKAKGTFVAPDGDKPAGN